MTQHKQWITLAVTESEADALAWMLERVPHQFEGAIGPTTVSLIERLKHECEVAKRSLEKRRLS